MSLIVLLYFVIGLSASMLGSMAGLGGGVIIKPILDLLDHYNLETIGVLSASTVLAMASASLFKMRNSNVRVEGRISFIIAIGSIFGGAVGKSIFNYSVVTLEMNGEVGLFQSSFLVVILVAIYLYIRYKKYIRTFMVESASVIFIMGILLGMISSFLGIGGGPLNVAMLSFLFSMNIKQAAMNSLLIIFFSQLSSLALTLYATGFGAYDLTVLPYMIVGGVLGGGIGSHIVKNINDRMIERIFNFTLAFIIMINVYNVIKSIL